MKIRYILLYISIISIFSIKFLESLKLKTNIQNQGSSESSYEELDENSKSAANTLEEKAKNQNSMQSTYAEEEEDLSGDLSSENVSEPEKKDEVKEKSLESKGEEITLENSNNEQVISQKEKNSEDNTNLSKDFVLTENENKKSETNEKSIVPKLSYKEDDEEDIIKSNKSEHKSEHKSELEAKQELEEKPKSEIKQESNVKKEDSIKSENEKDSEFQKASTSIKEGVPGSTIGHIVPQTLDLLLGVVNPTRTFTKEPENRPLLTQFGRKKSEDTNENFSNNYIPTPECNEVTEKFEWNKDLLGTSSQAAFKIIFGEITSLKSMTNIQAEKTITAAFDVLKDPAAEGINPQEALALYVCEADKKHGRTVYQKLIEYGYLSSLLHPIANKMWGCVKYGHYYDVSGNNPLHLAAKSNSLQVVDFVLRLIKDPIEIKSALEEKNMMNQTPLDIAVDERRPSIIRRFKTTYRTMSNFVKKLDPEAVLEEKKKQKIMTETAAMFCKPVLKMNSSENDAIENAIEKSKETNAIINNYSMNELNKDHVQKNLRIQKHNYQLAKQHISDRKNHISDTKQQPIRSYEHDKEYIAELSENPLEEEVVNYENEDHRSIHEIKEEVLSDKDNKSSYNKHKSDENTDPSQLEGDSDQPNEKNDDDQSSKPKSFLEKVLFWSIIVFCIVFTIVLLLIWFATKV